MSKTEDFLSLEEEKAVVAAIVAAEKQTSGEIRVHIEGHSEETAMARCQALFHYLKMDNTQDRNGVLIYVAVEDRLLAIVGDTGIDAVTPDDFWESTRDAMLSAFKNGQCAQGLINGVQTAGQALAQHFPWNDNDTNELPNAISKS